MYRIERADAKQESELAELGLHLAGEMYRLTPPLTRAPLEQMERGERQSIRELLTGGEGLVLAAWEDGRPAGYAAVHWKRPPREGCPPCAQLSSLYVCPDQRRKGLGRMLLERSMEECQESGAAFLSLNVLAGNEGAECLYRSMGFQDFRRSLWRSL